MDYKKLLTMQEELDNHIMKKQKLQFIKLSSLTLALSVELGETINSFAKWKYWKVNNQPKPDLLEEVSDFTHFLLSLSNRFQIDADTINSIGAVKYTEVETHFLQMQYVVSMIGNYGEAKDKQKFVIELWKLFKGMLAHMDFMEEQVEMAYLLKNKENYARQANSY